MRLALAIVAAFSAAACGRDAPPAAPPPASTGAPSLEPLVVAMREVDEASRALVAAVSEAAEAGREGTAVIDRLAALALRDPAARTSAEKEELEVVEKAVAASRARQKEAADRIEALTARIEAGKKTLDRLRAERPR